jgi:hypothetical protein
MKVLGSSRDWHAEMFDMNRGFSRRMCGAVGAAGTARLRAGAQRLIHDLLDGAGTAAALRAAAETSIDLPRRAWRAGPGDGIADIVVGKNVTGTNDHEMTASSQDQDPL